MSKPRYGSAYEQVIRLFQDWRAYATPTFNASIHDYSKGAMAAKLAGLSAYRGRLAAIDADALSLGERVDLELIRSELNGMEYYCTMLRPWERDPAFYSPLREEHGDVPDFEAPYHAAILCPYRFHFPLEAREYETFRLQLAAIPSILEQARANLTTDTKQLYAFAIAHYERRIEAIQRLRRRLAGMHPELVATCDEAGDATESFLAWVKTRHGGMRETPVGLTIDQYNWAMEHVHRVPYDWHEQEATLQRELDRAWASMKLEEHRNRDRPPLELPRDADEMAGRVRVAYPFFLNYLKSHDIFTVPNYMELTREPPQTLCPAEALDFFGHVEYRHLGPLRCHMVHYLELQREARNTHPIRRHVPLYKIWATRSEGLATAFEEIMMQAGFLDHAPRARELVHALAAFRAARGLAALRVHGQGWSIEQALDFSVRHTPRGWLRRNGELLSMDLALYHRTPIYGPSYTIGKVQLEHLMAVRCEQQGDAFTLKGFFDEYFNLGTIPASLIHWQMTGRRVAD